jgi:hypothetical protein
LPTRELGEIDRTGKIGAGDESSVIDEATTRIAEAASVTVVNVRAASGQSLERKRWGFGPLARGRRSARSTGPLASQSSWSGSIAMRSPRERVVRPLLRFFLGRRDATSTNLFGLPESGGQSRANTLTRNPSDALKAAISPKMSPYATAM